ELADPYELRAEDVRDPPRTLREALLRIGPGMILAASIVGSGELIATTTLGAQAGYVALWIILLSCAIKPVVQAEMGRYTIASGETGLEALDRVPGPRLKVNWLVWAWAIMVLLTLLQVGAMYGGVSQVMNLLVPAVPVAAWTLVFLAATSASSAWPWSRSASSPCSPSWPRWRSRACRSTSPGATWSRA
ncbi:MAG: hypothetical protein DMF79_16525, partial [Acidobacteria bacterium]